MDDRLTPRAKRLLIILMITPFLYLAVYYGAPMLPSQQRNLRWVECHIEDIQSEWREFKRDPDYQYVELFAWTGSNGAFGAYGNLPTEQHLEKLKSFMEGTRPPRPVYLGCVRVCDRELFEEMKMIRSVGHTDRKANDSGHGDTPTLHSPSVQEAGGR
jgi:hypothetical protein